MIVPNCTWDDRKKYRFTLASDFEINLNLKKLTSAQEINFFSGSKLLASSSGDFISIKKGFAWDGCSPCKAFGLSWFSTPTPTATICPSLCHDLFYQFLPINGCPWNREWADNKFKALMDANKFIGSWVYYEAVRSFGWIALNSKKDNAVNCRIVYSK